MERWIVVITAGLYSALFLGLMFRQELRNMRGEK